MKTIVSIETCSAYELSRVQESVARLLAPLGGIEAFVKPGSRVLLKPNLLYARRPELAVTTHPVVVEAVARMALDRGAQVFVGDSPPLPSARRVARECGVLEVTERLGIPMVEFDTPGSSFRGRQTYTQTISTPHTESSLKEYDVIINLPKLKSHCQMVMTGAVKNLFGCVNGRKKALWHFRMRKSADDFAAMLLAIMEKVAPELTIVDAIVAMEGDNGPTAGTPKPMGLLLAGTDCVAVDRVISELIRLPVRENTVLRQAKRLGFPSAELEAIDVEGLPLSQAKADSFALPEMIPIGFSLYHLARGLVRHFVKKYIRKEVDQSA